MNEPDNASSRACKQYIAEQIWLHYYNDYLYQSGTITETERNRLQVRINRRTPSTPLRCQ